MQSDAIIERQWQARCRSAPFFSTMRMTDAGLLLGRATALAKFPVTEAGGLDAQSARASALLSAAFGKPAPEAVLESMRRACDLWSYGDKALAQIRLAFPGVPLVDELAAHRLFVGEMILNAGFSPRTMLKALGFDPALLDKYDPDQPRVPAGQGRESGQWTTGDAGNQKQNRQFVRIDLPVVGATRSDMRPPGGVVGAPYAQISQTPILRPEDLKHITETHGATAPPGKGQFFDEFGTAEGIRNLVNQAWAQATPDDVAAGRWGGRVVLGMAVFDRNPETGVSTPVIIGRSAEGRPVPSVPTNTYVVIMNSDMKVITCYPINPADDVNPRNE